MPVIKSTDAAHHPSEPGTKLGIGLGEADENSAILRLSSDAADWTDEDCRAISEKMFWSRFRFCFWRGDFDFRSAVHVF